MPRQSLWRAGLACDSASPQQRWLQRLWLPPPPPPPHARPKNSRSSVEHAVARPHATGRPKAVVTSLPPSLLSTTSQRRWGSARRRCSPSAELVRASTPGAVAAATAEGVGVGVGL